MSEPTRVQLEAISTALRAHDDAAVTHLLHRLGLPEGWRAVAHLRDRLGDAPPDAAPWARSDDEPDEASANSWDGHPTG